MSFTACYVLSQIDKRKMVEQIPSKQQISKSELCPYWNTISSSTFNSPLHECTLNEAGCTCTPILPAHAWTIPSVCYGHVFNAIGWDQAQIGSLIKHFTCVYIKIKNDSPYFILSYRTNFQVNHNSTSTHIYQYIHYFPTTYATIIFSHKNTPRV